MTFEMALLEREAEGIEKGEEKILSLAEEKDVVE